MPYRAPRDNILLAALEMVFPGRSRRDLRRLLHEGRVRLNGRAVEDPRAPVRAGDEIECTRAGKPHQVHPCVRIVHEDEDLIVVEKDAGILTAGGVAGGPPTVVSVLDRYLRQRGRRRRVEPCQRLDRDVSGLCLFAQNARTAHAIRDDSRRFLKDRVYHALVEGVPTRREGRIESHLEDGVDRVVRPAAPGKGRLCVTEYRVLESAPRYATLEVRLQTGRKNQIRAHLSQMGHPVAGDRKYGARTDPARRVCLHAARLTIVHPRTGAVLELTSRIPAGFARPPAGLSRDATSRSPEY